MTVKNCVPIILILLCVSGCRNSSQRPGESVLARVGNDILTLEQALQEIPESVLVQDTLAALDRYQSNWIDSKILEQEADRIGIEQNPELIRRLERVKTQLVENAIKDLIISQYSDQLEVSREEAQNYYQAHRNNFVLGERYVRFRHLTTRTRVEADNAQQDLMRGIPWPEVAESYSIHPELQIRESEHFLPASMALADIPIMNNYIQNRIGITEISPIQEHGGYFHFVQLMEANDTGDHPDLEWLINQITEWLKLEKTQRLVNSYIRNLYLQAEANNEIERVNVSDIERSQIQTVLSTDTN